MSDREYYTTAIFPLFACGCIQEQKLKTQIGLVVGRYNDMLPEDIENPARVTVEACGADGGYSFVLERETAVAMAHALMAAASDCQRDERFHKRHEQEGE